MSETRQPSQPAAPLVRSLAVRYSSGSVLDPHSHSWGQLVYASEGVMTVRTDDGTWVVPSHRAVWIPSGVEHSIEMTGWVFMRTLYFAPEFDPPLPGRCCVVPVSPLLRELILHTVTLGTAGRADAREARLVDFLRDQLEALPVVPSSFPCRAIRGRSASPVPWSTVPATSGPSRRWRGARARAGARSSVSSRRRRA